MVTDQVEVGGIKAHFQVILYQLCGRMWAETIARTSLRVVRFRKWGRRAAMLSWDLEVKVGGVERALLHSPTQVLPWSPFSRLTEGLETEGFAFLWFTALSVKWEK